MGKNIDIIHSAKFWKPNIQEDVLLYKGHFNTFEFDKHVHDDYTITLVQEGEMKAFLNGFSHSFYKPTILTLNPDEVHACKTLNEEGYKYNSIYFNSSLLSKIYGEKEASNMYFKDSILENKQIHQQLTSLVSNDENNMISKIDFECEFIDILKNIMYLNTNSNTNLNTYKNDNLITKAKEFINDNFSLDLTLDDISSELDISKYHFLRLFKEKTYLSPHSYLMIKRVEKAKQSLQNGESIVSTAQLCGFNDQSHLHRRFKALTGLTPGNYQKFFN